MQPLALVSYESLLAGNQLVNQLHELGYRTSLVPDLSQAAAQAAREKPLVLLIQLASQAGPACDAIRQVKAGTDTGHVPILAFGKFDGTKEERQLADQARVAGADLVAAEAGLRAQLPGLLDQVLHLD